jgi:hypothetical protein
MRLGKALGFSSSVHSPKKKPAYFCGSTASPGQAPRGRRPGHTTLASQHFRGQQIASDFKASKENFLK